MAQGEYNINYIFAHPITGKKLVLRVNCGSQMHLDNQITYEYRALELLERSGRTPAVYYVDDTKQFINNGVLVMEYLPGHPLIYEKEMDKALAVLADIHSVNIEPQNKGEETVSISAQRYWLRENLSKLFLKSVSRWLLSSLIMSRLIS